MHAAPPLSTVAAALVSAAAVELAAHGPSGVSLRAVARRAGVSHAAPKHHFRDRAGVLTALATDGFRRLADDLHRAGATATSDPADRVAALGRAYLDFGLAQPQLFDLMFRPEHLHRDDPDLLAAQRASFAVLATAVGDTGGHHDTSAIEAPLIGWALVHGLVVLVRDGALQALTGTDDPADLARTLTATFARWLPTTPRD